MTVKTSSIALMILTAAAGSASANAQYYFSYPHASAGNLSGHVNNGGPYENNIGPTSGGGNGDLLQTASVVDSSGSTASASIAEGPVYLQAQTSSGPGADYYLETAQATADLKWTIDVLGGPSPVTFQALLQSGGSGGPSFGYESSGSISVDNTTLGQVCASSFPGACTVGAVATLNQTVTLSAGTHYLDEQVSTFSDGNGSTAFANADPKIFIDPAFLATHPGYGLEVPLGLTTSAAPEPEVWVMILAGMALMGRALRRRGAERPVLLR